MRAWQLEAKASSTGMNPLERLFSRLFRPLLMEGPTIVVKIS
jgi:hypothetical protein